MASTTFPPDPPAPEPVSQPVIDMAEFGRTLARRRAELGEPDAPRNSGARRTSAKRALLKAIEDAGGRW